MLEHPSQINITQSELAPRVADYFDNLLAQRDAILASYNLTPETAEKFCDLHTTDEDREAILALYEKILYVIENKRIPTSDKYWAAQEIMQEDFLGIEAIEKTFNIHLKPEDIPDIPFSIEEIKRAQELGQFLILRVDTTDDGTLLTMEHMENMFADTFQNEGQGAIISRFSTPCRKEEYFIEETPRLSWALVSKKFIHGSTEKNYVEQTSLIIDYLKKEIFQGNTPPEPWQSAILEFEQEKDFLTRITDSNWKEISEKLEKLKITSLMRHTPVEVLYDFLVYFRNTNNRLWEHWHTWTGRCDSNGGLVLVGRFNFGADVWSNRPSSSSVNFGVSFSRLR